MDPNLDIFLRIFAIAAQISIPVVIFYAGRQIARAQFLKSTQDAWNEFNKLAIHNCDNVRVGQSTLGFGWPGQDEDSFRKAYLVFVGLNAIMTVYYGSKHKLLPPDYRIKNVEQILAIWLADDQIFDLTQTRGYPMEFQKLCKSVREKGLGSSAFA